MEVLRHVDKGCKVIVMPLVGPIDGFTEQASPEMICEQWQTVVTRTGQLVAVAGIVVVPDSLAMGSWLAEHAARIMQRCTANKLAVAPGARRWGVDWWDMTQGQCKDALLTS
jgi:hypothetical protein